MLHASRIQGSRLSSSPIRFRANKWYREIAKQREEGDDYHRHQVHILASGNNLLQVSITTHFNSLYRARSSPFSVEKSNVQVAFTAVHISE
jgi:hypothetical protein